MELSNEREKSQPREIADSKAGVRSAEEGFMKKPNSITKLTLHRETLRELNEPALMNVRGGGAWNLVLRVYAAVSSTCYGSDGGGGSNSGSIR